MVADILCVVKAFQPAWIFPRHQVDQYRTRWFGIVSTQKFIIIIIIIYHVIIYMYILTTYVYIINQSFR